MGPKAPRPRPPKGSFQKTQLKDDSIMGTNNSSIVSKCSVERIYFPDEKHYFRHFVKRPQRRSPLINRGYWLRMRAIHHVVHQFLQQTYTKRKVVINMGCGYDPLPWQCFSRYPDASKKVIFIDIDYKDLMIKKRDIVEGTSQLNSALTNCKYSNEDILLQSDQYIQLGCDLRNLPHLQEVLGRTIDTRACSILFTAEVSIAYMDVDPADSLIKWAATLPEARFCLLEQLMPAGVSHPFAQMMMAHFEKLNTPLRPVRRYPTTSDQESRFKILGWPSVRARNLWELWSASDFLDSSERELLNFIEPFDEWEELATYGCHYVLLVADGQVPSGNPVIINPNSEHTDDTSMSVIAPTITYSAYQDGNGCKRFASVIPMRISNTSQNTFGNFAGMGLSTRVSTIDIFGTHQVILHGHKTEKLSFVPSGRMCHTTTDLGDIGTLLVGGRASPDTAFADCWLYQKWSGVWERVSDMPNPRYRHQAIHLGQGHVLVSTGRLNSCTIAEEFLIWSRPAGWVTCIQGDGERPLARYGATFLVNAQESTQSQSTKRGIFAGGMSQEGIIYQDAWQWEVHCYLDNPTIKFSRLTPEESMNSIARFGASVISHNRKNYVIGGVTKDNLPRADVIEVLESSNGTYTVSPVFSSYGIEFPRPLLIGISVVSVGQDLVIIGGGAVCFAFGTFWNKGCYTIHMNGISAEKPASWRFILTIDPSTIPKSTDDRSLLAISSTINCGTSDLDQKKKDLSLTDR